MTETDGIDEALDGQLRIAITVAGQVGEYLARTRENALVRARAAGEHEARELAARLHAERATARAELAPVGQHGWWEHTTTDQIAHAWQVARAWSCDDPDARAAADRMRTEISSRYAIDVEDAGVSAVDVQAALDQAVADRKDADAERARAAVDEAEAAALMRQADGKEHRAQQGGPGAEHTYAAATAMRDDAELVYDSAERRQHLAHDLEAKGTPRDVIETHVRADISQATPHEAAVNASRAVRARRNPRRGRIRGSKVELSR